MATSASQIFSTGSGSPLNDYLVTQAPWFFFHLEKNEGGFFAPVDQRMPMSKQGWNNSDG